MAVIDAAWPLLVPHAVIILSRVIIPARVLISPHVLYSRMFYLKGSLEAPARINRVPKTVVASVKRCYRRVTCFT